MTAAGGTTSTHLDPIVTSELERGNRVRKPWSRETGPHSGYYTIELLHPLDLEAIRAQFDLPDSITLMELPSGVTSVLDQLDGTGVSGGPKPRGRREQELLEDWWVVWRSRPRPRTPIRNPSFPRS